MHQQGKSTSERKKLTVWLDKKTIQSIQVIREQTGLSISSLVKQALLNYFSHNEIKNAAERLQRISENISVELKNFEEYRLPEIRAEVREMIYQIKQLNSRFDQLVQLLEVVAFWSALAVELFKTRLFNTRPLSPEEYENYKTLWQKVHEIADARVESLLGKRIWKQQFDPARNPLEK